MTPVIGFSDLFHCLAWFGKSTIYPVPLHNSYLSRLLSLHLGSHHPGLRRSRLLVFGILFTFILVGFLVVRSYGASWDEPARIHYAKHSLSAYLRQDNNLADEKGPFFVMLAWLGAQALPILLNGWRFIEAWHFMTFLSFVSGLYFFYRLCRRLVAPRAALAAMLLFGTQPLIWGHAFINPKDIPFMAFFLGAVVLGLEMVDVFEHQAEPFRWLGPAPSWAGYRQSIASQWQAAPRRWRTALLSASLVWFILVAGHRVILAGIAGLIQLAFTASSTTFLGSIFARLAQHAGQVPLDSYILKGQLIYIKFAIPVHWLLFILIVVLLGWIFQRLPRYLLGGWFQKRVLLAGAFLGFATSIRVLGPAAGGMVALYFLFHWGRKAWPTVLVYLGCGAIITYLTWPALWNSPLANYLASFMQAADFEWNGNVAFAGQLYPSGATPSYYMPALLGFQFTEPALILIVGGLLLGLVWLVRRPHSRLDILLLLAWFFLPLSAAIVFRINQYDNFRHFLFIIPPLFIFAALGLHFLVRRIKWAWVFGLVVILCLAPGLYWDVALHPYQYIYYNSLVGGPAGAFRNFETDYWTTSYKAATEYLNKEAPLHAMIVVWGPDQIVSIYARPDLKVVNVTGAWNVQAGYAVLSSRNNYDLSLYPDAPILFRVQSAGATLTVIKQLNPP